MIELVVRLVFSLAVVVGMLLLLARFSAKRFRGSTDALVRVVHRQPLSRTSAVAVVTVGSRVLVLGTTEHQVQLLTELDADELELPELEAAEEGVTDESPSAGQALPGRAPVSGRRFQPMRALGAARAGDSALAGSLLSTQTWRQAFAAATGGTDRDAS